MEGGKTVSASLCSTSGCVSRGDTINELELRTEFMTRPVSGGTAALVAVDDTATLAAAVGALIPGGAFPAVVAVPAMTA
jgi:hypothetical protein